MVNHIKQITTIVMHTQFTRLTIKAIIRWEQLRGRSFSLMDYTDREDIVALLYTAYITEHGGNYTQEVFSQVLMDEKLFAAMSSEVGRVMEVISQFSRKNGNSVSETDTSTTPDTIGSIVSTLIMSGLDAHYALNEMELQDLPLYIEAYENKRKDEMENARLWTYLTILPHIDAKAMENGAKDLITFPWEQKPKEETEINDAEVERFEEFLKKGKKLWQEN